MPQDDDRPLATAELIELDDQDCVEEDLRPWGHVNEHAYAYTSDDRPQPVTTEFDGVYGGAGRVIRRPTSTRPARLGWVVVAGST